mmetsp:Transcript_25506/g.73654  ORF Transcript_25506/g.73654 Transcript_25506/m.73654 type:complete len:215 (-) Transcript_25506:68-712(-)
MPNSVLNNRIEPHKESRARSGGSTTFWNTNRSMVDNTFLKANSLALPPSRFMSLRWMFTESLYDVTTFPFANMNINVSAVPTPMHDKKMATATGTVTATRKGNTMGRPRPPPSFPVIQLVPVIRVENRVSDRLAPASSDEELRSDVSSSELGSSSPSPSLPSSSLLLLAPLAVRALAVLCARRRTLAMMLPMLRTSTSSKSAAGEPSSPRRDSA